MQPYPSQHSLFLTNYQHPLLAKKNYPTCHPLSKLGHLLPVLDTARKSTTTTRTHNSEDFLTGDRECWTLLFIIPSISQHTSAPSSAQDYLSHFAVFLSAHMYTHRQQHQSGPLPFSSPALILSFAGSLLVASCWLVDDNRHLSGVMGPLPSLWPPLHFWAC